MFVDSTAPAPPPTLSRFPTPHPHYHLRAIGSLLDTDTPVTPGDAKGNAGGDAGVDAGDDTGVDAGVGLREGSRVCPRVGPVVGPRVRFAKSKKKTHKCVKCSFFFSKFNSCKKLAHMASEVSAILSAGMGPEVLLGEDPRVGPVVGPSGVSGWVQGWKMLTKYMQFFYLSLMLNWSLVTLCSRLPWDLAESRNLYQLFFVCAVQCVPYSRRPPLPHSHPKESV